MSVFITVAYTEIRIIKMAINTEMQSLYELKWIYFSFCFHDFAIDTLIYCFIALFGPFLFWGKTNLIHRFLPISCENIHISNDSTVFAMRCWVKSRENPNRNENEEVTENGSINSVTYTQLIWYSKRFVVTSEKATDVNMKIIKRCHKQKELIEQKKE